MLTKFVLFYVLLLSPTLLRAEAESTWAGTWQGQGEARMFGQEPIPCVGVEIRVRQIPSSQGTLLERDGHSFFCGPYKIVAKPSQVLLRDGLVFWEELPIGYYESQKISIALACPSCAPGLRLTQEVAELTSTQSYSLFYRLSEDAYSASTIEYTLSLKKL